MAAKRKWLFYSGLSAHQKNLRSQKKGLQRHWQSVFTEVPAILNFVSKQGWCWLWKETVEGKQINDSRFWKKDFWRKLDMPLGSLKAKLCWVKVGCSGKLVDQGTWESLREGETFLILRQGLLIRQVFKGPVTGRIGLNSRTAILIRAKKLGAMIWRTAYQPASHATCPMAGCYHWIY